MTRTEQYDSSGWTNDYKVEYTWNALEWMRKEQRWDWALGSWVAKYDVNQEYDKRGNRTRYDKNVQGSGADYGIAYDLGYTFDGSSLLTAITDADNGAYSASVTCDANSNITSIDEVMTGTGHTPQNNHVYTYFDVDDLNRVTAYRTKNYNGLNWMWEKRAHAYDGLGRATQSTYKNWIDGTTEPAGTSIEHVYSKDGEHLQNYDGSSTYGSVWHWAGADPMPETRHALKSPNADTASQTGYNLATNASPQERTFLNPTTEGDRRHLWGQGRPMAKDSSGSGSNWATGLKSNVQNINQVVVESRLDYSGTVSATVDRGTDAREKGRIGIFGTMLSYAGSYGRVTSEALGRDINPLGRGDGMAYVAGWLRLGRLAPLLINTYSPVGQGNSVNNGCNGCESKKYSDDPEYRKCVDRCRNETNSKNCDLWCLMVAGDKTVGQDGGGKPVGALIQPGPCGNKSDKPCAGSTSIGAILCDLAGTKFDMPSPRAFCEWKHHVGTTPEPCSANLMSCDLNCLKDALTDSLMLLVGSVVKLLGGNKVEQELPDLANKIFEVGIDAGDRFHALLVALFDLALGFLAQALAGEEAAEAAELSYILTKLGACTACCFAGRQGCAGVEASGSCTTDPPDPTPGSCKW